MRITRATLDRYAKSLDGVGEKAKRQMMRELDALDFSDMTEAITSAVAIVTRYAKAASGASAELASIFYDTVREAEVGRPLGAKPIAATEAAGTEGAVRAFAQRAVDGDIQAFKDACASRIGYEVRRAAGQTVMGNARSDSRKVKYARVPGGGETCSFCLMLASRGFVYATAESAGDDGHYHDNCQCMIVPSFAKSEVEGYDPDALYRAWKDSTGE